MLHMVCTWCHVAHGSKQYYLSFWQRAVRFFTVLESNAKQLKPAYFSTGSARINFPSWPQNRRCRLWRLRVSFSQIKINLNTVHLSFHERFRLISLPRNNRTPVPPRVSCRLKCISLWLTPASTALRVF